MSAKASSQVIKRKMTRFNSRSQKHRTKKWLSNAITYLFVFMLVIAILAPFVWMIISSISPQVELSTKPPHWFPQNPTLSRYRALIFGSKTTGTVPTATEKFLRGMLSSAIVSVATTLICVVTGTMAAYALARLPVFGKNSFLIGTMSAQMVPVIVIIIPLYLLLQKIDLIDSWQGLILLYTGFMLPTVIWIMHSYFLTIPKGLEEAALIDGCTRITALIKVILPLSGPGLVAVSSFTFLSSWNEFFMALIFTSSHAKTITVVVTEFSSQFGVDYGLMATGGVIGSLPPLILAFLLQRYIVEGLTAGALKGE